jgi:hypothetical protein
MGVRDCGRPLCVRVLARAELMILIGMALNQLILL